MSLNDPHNLTEHPDLSTRLLTLFTYFDHFKHPLTLQDLQFLVQQDPITLQAHLDRLVQLELVYCAADYYSTVNDPSPNVAHRKRGELNAKPYFDKLPKYAKLIAAFPFVRGVAISGSLSKGVIQEDGDIDFFIITAPKRLWTARTLLILYKKIRLLNSRKYFCLNYFIDTENLSIKDKNMFTAIEIKFLIPAYNQNEVLQQFFEQNQWLSSFVALHDRKDELSNVPVYTAFPRVKKALEWLFTGKVGNVFEQWAHTKTLQTWEKKFQSFDKAKFELTLRSTAGVSKHHPQDFQSKVLGDVEKKAALLIDTYIALTTTP